MQIDLKGKAAIVTGSTTGIGRTIAISLAANGADIVINSFIEDGSEAVVEEIKAMGSRAFFVKADVSDALQAKELTDRTIEEFGKIDILVNNAGITRDNLIPMMSEEDFDNVIRVNLRGSFLMTKQVYMPMMKQRSGVIINISSVVGVIGNAGQANYSASKAGVIGLTKSTAKELGGRGIRVNAIAPGYIETPMTKILSDEVKTSMLKSIPLGRFGIPADVAGMVCFLCGQEASYITGQVIAVDGGMAI